MVVPGFAEILTETGKFGFTVVLIVLDVAVELTTHDKSDVNTQYTPSPFVRVVVVNSFVVSEDKTPPSYHL